MLIASAGGAILILKELQRQQDQTTQIAGRITSLNQQVVHLVGEVEKLRTELSRHADVISRAAPTTISPRRSRQARSHEDAAAALEDTSSTPQPPAEADTKKRTSGRKRKTQPASDAEEG
ncbi:MAG TPA: hypothetical protein VF600_18665 [Abditibacteriaceae bacterium]